MSVFMDLKGTSLTTIQIGKGGPRFKASAGALQAKDAADSAFVDWYAKELFLAGEKLVINNDAAEAAADWKYTLGRPAAGMTENLTLNLPPTKGNAGELMRTDGAGNLSFVPPVAGGMLVDTTNLVFGSGATVTLFTLPANAQVLDVEVIIDTPWDDTGIVEIGLLGTQGKYMGTGDNDLENSIAGDSWSAKKNNVPVGITEDLKAYYTAGGAETVGAARVIVSYVIPI